jgi:hypothetical protein
MTGPAYDRVRFRFSKQGKVRFTSHRDVARMWERALRRSGLPVAYSEGFSPHPLLSFGLALPTCCESLAEYVEARLDTVPAPTPPSPIGPVTRVGAPFDPLDLPPLLSSLLPEGVDVQRAGLVSMGADSLQQEVTSCSWEMEVLGLAAEELSERIERLLDAPSVPVRRERKGRLTEDDLRPSVLALTLVEGVGGPVPPEGSPKRISAELATQPRGVRPMELIEGLGADLVLARACRTHQWIERDGARWEPLPASSETPGAGARHAQERAS